MRFVYGLVLLIVVCRVAGAGEDLLGRQGPTTLAGRLRVVKVPRFRVDALSVEDTLKVLRNQTLQLDADGVGFNILYKCSKQKKRQLISLDLAGVPVTDLIYFVCLQSGLNFRIEKHAVVVWEIQEKEKMNKY